MCSSENLRTFDTDCNWRAPFRPKLNSDMAVIRRIDLSMYRLMYIYYIYSISYLLFSLLLLLFVYNGNKSRGTDKTQSNSHCCRALYFRFYIVAFLVKSIKFDMYHNMSVRFANDQSLIFFEVCMVYIWYINVWTALWIERYSSDECQHTIFIHNLSYNMYIYLYQGLFKPQYSIC